MKIRFATVGLVGILACDGEPGQPIGGLPNPSYTLVEHAQDNSYAWHIGDSTGSTIYQIEQRPEATKLWQRDREQIRVRTPTGEVRLSALGLSTDQRAEYILGDVVETKETIDLSTIKDSTGKLRQLTYSVNGTPQLVLREAPGTREPRYLRGFTILDGAGKSLGAAWNKHTTDAHRRVNVYDVQIDSLGGGAILPLMLTIMDKVEDARDKQIDDDRADMLEDVIDAAFGDD